MVAPRGSAAIVAIPSSPPAAPYGSLAFRDGSACTAATLRILGVLVKAQGRLWDRHRWRARTRQSLSHPFLVRHILVRGAAAPFVVTAHVGLASRGRHRCRRSRLGVPCPGPASIAEAHSPLSILGDKKLLLLLLLRMLVGRPGSAATSRATAAPRRSVAVDGNLMLLPLLGLDIAGMAHARWVAATCGIQRGRC